MLLSSGAQAVTWSVVSVSAVVNQGGPEVSRTVLSSRTYLARAVTQTGAPLSDLFIGFREDTGQVAVVRISNESIAYNIISGLGAGGSAANALNSKGTTSLPATVSSLNTDFAGYVFDSFARKADGSIKSVNRLFIGGAGTQTIKGTVKTTGKKFNL